MYFVSGMVSDISILELTTKILQGGGKGPGSYYFWIYLQFAFLLPFIAVILRKFGLWTNFIIMILIAESLEIICCFVQVPEWLYRLLFFRYFFLIFIGYFLVKKKVKPSLPMVLTTLLSAAAILAFKYGDVSLEPLFFRSDWKTQHWVTYGYVLFVIYILVQIFKKTYSTRLTRLILALGKYSYEIFLWQMIYFSIPIRSVLIRLFSNNVAMILYITMSLLLCTLPVLYVKCKNDLIGLWNTRR